MLISVNDVFLTGGFFSQSLLADLNLSACQLLLATVFSSRMM